MVTQASLPATGQRKLAARIATVAHSRARSRSASVGGRGVTARAGTGVDGFYRGLGHAEVGRLPGAIRVAPGDDRDEIIMACRL